MKTRAASDLSAWSEPTWGQAVRVALPAWVAARVLVGAGWLGAELIQWFRDEPRTSKQQSGFFAWDGNWYRSIADNGYDFSTEAIRFFPLYPLIGRVAGLGVAPGVALVVVANLAALALGAAVYVLVIDLARDPLVARRSVWAVALWPASFVLVLAYTEALAALLVVGIFLGLRRAQWELVAVLGAAAGLLRPVGLLLTLPVAVCAVRDLPAGISARLWRAAAVVAPVAGAGTFLAWSAVAGHGWFGPFDAQRPLRGSFVLPPVRLARAVADLFTGEFLDGLHAPFVLFMVATTVAVVWKLPIEYGVFTVASLLVAVSAENLNSVERYALSAVPMLLVVGWFATTATARRIGLPVAASGLVALSTLAFLGEYVP